MPGVSSRALSAASFPVQYSCKLYNEESVRIFFRRAGRSPNLKRALCYFLIQLFTSGCVRPMAGWARPVSEVAANFRFVGHPEVIAEPVLKCRNRSALPIRGLRIARLDPAPRNVELELAK